MSLLLVQHRPVALANTRSRPINGRASDLEAEADVLERQAVELRKGAERLSDRARQLRTMARQLRGQSSSNASRADESADLPSVAASRRRGSPTALTPRQRDIARLVADGRTNRQIAQELVITVGTVANHVAQILGRLGLENRVQLAAWALMHREVWHDRTPTEATNGQATLE